MDPINQVLISQEDIHLFANRWDIDPAVLNRSNDGLKYWIWPGLTSLAIHTAVWICWALMSVRLEEVKASNRDGICKIVAGSSRRSRMP